jgi:hypothetical protein
MDLAALVDHLRRQIGRHLAGEERRGIGPVGKGQHAAGGPVGVEAAQAVADRDAELVAIDPGQRGQDIDSGMGDQWCVVFGEECALVVQEVEQVRDLLEIRRDIRVVAPQVHVVELEIDDVLDLIPERIELTAGRLAARAKRRRGAERQCYQQRSADNSASSHIAPPFEY